MRESTRLVSIVVAVGAIAIGAGSALTASNTVPASVAGFGGNSVTGATVTAVHYVQNAADASKLDSVNFDTSTDITGTTVTLMLKDGSNADLGGPYSCTYGAAVAGSTAITCDVTSVHPSVAALATTDLTVSTT